MFEFALHPAAQLQSAPDAELVTALAAAAGIDAHLVPKLALERSILRELPGERLVERVALRSPDEKVVACAVAKAEAGGQSERLFTELSPLPLPIPRLLAYLPHHRLLLMEEVRGERLDHQILAGGGEEAARRAGAAVAMFHRQRPAGLERITIERLLASLRPSPPDLPPDLGDRAVTLAAALRALPDPVGRRAVLCHRDLHPRQIVDAGTRVILVDLDLAGLGHPALDLANLEVYLRLRQPRRAGSLFAAFAAGYAAAGGRRDDPEAERFYRAFTHLRLAVKTYRTAPAGWRKAAVDLLIAGQAEIGLEAAARQEAAT